MSKMIVHALAVGALALVPAIAAAKGSAHTGGGIKGGGTPTVRQHASSNKPQPTFKKLKLLHCGKYGRGDGYGGVTMVTVCN